MPNAFDNATNGLRAVRLPTLRDGVGDDFPWAFIARLTSESDEYECVGECRIGRPAADFTNASRAFFRRLMNTSSHDFVTVDMRGLKAALAAHARGKGVSVSMVVRDAVARALEVAEAARPMPASAGEGPAAGAEMVKLSMRLPRADAARLDLGAKGAGLSRGAYVSQLSAEVAALPDGPKRADQLSALITSNSELSSLSRDIRHLTALLAHGEVRAAKEYRQMLDTVAGDLHRHLQLASAVLGDLRPRHGGAGAVRHSSQEEKGKA